MGDFYLHRREQLGMKTNWDQDQLGIKGVKTEKDTTEVQREVTTQGSYKVSTRVLRFPEKNLCSRMS